MIDRVILDVEILDAEFRAEAFGSDQRGEAGKRPGLGLAVDRQQLAIAPQIMRARFDQLARDGGANARVVVSDFERTEARFAYVQRADRIFLAAFAAFQIGDVAHRRSFVLIARVRLDLRRCCALECAADASRPRIYFGEADARGSRAVVGENTSVQARLDAPR